MCSSSLCRRLFEARAYRTLSTGTLSSLEYSIVTNHISRNRRDTGPHPRKEPVYEPILATATLRHQLHGQVAGAMSILAPCANRTKARPCRSYQDRSTAGRLLLSGESFECLHPSFLTARHLCCTRPPDCHVCRSQPRNKRDRRTSFQRRGLVVAQASAQISSIHGSSRTGFKSALAHVPPRTGPKTRLCGSSHSIFSRTSRPGRSPELSRFEDFRPGVSDGRRC